MLIKVSESNRIEQPAAPRKELRAGMLVSRGTAHMSKDFLCSVVFIHFGNVL